VRNETRRNKDLQSNENVRSLGLFVPDRDRWDLQSYSPDSSGTESRNQQSKQRFEKGRIGMNFDFNFWSILFLILGYVLGSFTKRVGKSNEIDQIIRDAAQIQATNRDLETANDKLNQTLFESTKENQRLLNENSDLLTKIYGEEYFNAQP